MEFLEIILKRFATKKFDTRRLDAVQVGQLLEMVRYAPSAFNLQPWKIKVVSDQKLKEKLYPHSNNQPQITTCSHLLVFCANTDLAAQIDRLEALMRKAMIPEEQIHDYIGFVRAYTGNIPSNRILCWAQNNVFLALANAINGAKALGFDSCPMGGFDPAAYAKILKIPDHLVPTALCPLGYASDAAPPKRRFPVEEIVI